MHLYMHMLLYPNKSVCEYNRIQNFIFIYNFFLCAACATDIILTPNRDHEKHIYVKDNYTHRNKDLQKLVVLKDYIK